MFTGIIEAVGSISALQPSAGDLRLHVATGSLGIADLALGESIAVNGVCLTVVAFSAEHFEADVSNETLRCTTLGALQPGSKVNLERAMRADGRFGGHIVSGHVDGVGEVQSITSESRSQIWRKKVRFASMGPA
jgi:riboflavin synthase